jgi:hypothetical protein
MMTLEIAAETMRANTQETNRLNRQRRSSLISARHELAENRESSSRRPGSSSSNAVGATPCPTG